MIALRLLASRIDYVESWPLRLSGLLYEQFRGLPNFEAIATDVLGPQAQEIEDASQVLTTLTSVADSEGAQLDLLGAIFGQPRWGFSDEIYRVLIVERAYANTVSGEVDNVLTVESAIFYNTAGSTAMRYYPEGDATFRLNTSASIPHNVAIAAARFLGSLHADGVRALFEWQESDDAHAFTFDGGGGLGFGDSTDATVGGEFAAAAET